MLAASVLAQVPQKISYQAIIRNTDNKLLTNAVVGMRISILQDSATGAAVYVETQKAFTNVNGLASIEIGSGIAISGTFAQIDWSANVPYFIKTEIDPNGGVDYSISGTSQFYSVPYALYAENSGNSTPGPRGPRGLGGPKGDTGGYPVHKIGEHYGGGIVFFVYDGGQHGLIAAPENYKTNVGWCPGIPTYSRAKADGVGAGRANTVILIGKVGYDNGAMYAARACNEYFATADSVTYGDWYLPSKFELNLMYLQKGLLGMEGIYWSSTESTSLGDKTVITAWAQLFASGGQVSVVQTEFHSVRPIRAF